MCLSPPQSVERFDPELRTCDAGGLETVSSELAPRSHVQPGGEKSEYRSPSHPMSAPLSPSLPPSLPKSLLFVHLTNLRHSLCWGLVPDCFPSLPLTCSSFEKGRWYGGGSGGALR